MKGVEEDHCLLSLVGAGCCGGMKGGKGTAALHFLHTELTSLINELAVLLACFFLYSQTEDNLALVIVSSLRSFSLSVSSNTPISFCVSCSF